MDRFDVTLLGKSYTLACPPDERAILEQAAQLLDSRMRQMREAGKVPTDKIPVMAALQIAVEMLTLKRPDGPLGELAVADFQRKIDHMRHVLDEALEPQERLF